MNFVASDLGASGTRYVSDSGKINVLPNNVVVLETGAVTNLEPNAEDIESNLELTIVKDGASQYFPVTLLAGKMAERYSSIFETPDINRHKHDQRINYWSAIMSVAVSKIKYGLDDDLLFVLDVPPIELVPSRKAFKEALVGSYTVTFPKYMGGTEVKFNIVDVQAYEESVMAMASFFFNMAGVPKEENKDFMRGKVLSLDIGASTSDLAVIQDGKFLDYTGRTIKTGGNVARGTFINLITAQEGYDLPEADAEKAIADGRIAVGNGYKEVGDLVNEAKKELAGQLTSSLSTYFQQIRIPIQQIRAIVVSGGGSMAGQYINNDGDVIVTSEPLSKFVTEALQAICPGVVAVPYGEDARFANVKGLFIRSKLLLAKLLVARQQAEAPVQKQVQATATPVQQTVQTPVQPVTPVATQQAVQPSVTPINVQPVQQPAVQQTAQPVAQTVQTVQPTVVPPVTPVI